MNDDHWRDPAIVEPLDEDFPLPHLDYDEDPEYQKQMLNDIDGGIIGSEKPRIEYTKEYWTTPSMFEDSDNMPNDPEQADWSDLND